MPLSFDLSFWIWFSFIIFCGLMWHFTMIRPWQKARQRAAKAQKLDVVLYGILEHQTGGARTWLTPFDIKSLGAAFRESVEGLERDDDIDFCTIFSSTNGETAKPVFTVGRPDLDTLKPHA